MNYLHWPLGLSDAIAFADLAIKLADGKPTVVPCLKKNEVSVRSIFALHDNIEVRVVLDGTEHDLLASGSNAIHMGEHTGVVRNIDEDRIQWMYRSVGRDPEERFADMVILKAAAKVEQVDDITTGDAVKSQCVFLHDQPDKEHIIDRSRVKREYWNGLVIPTAHDDISILSWVRILLMTGNVHCIDSAFLHLTDAVQHQGDLYYHKYAKPGSCDYKSLGWKWTTLE